MTKFQLLAAAAVAALGAACAAGSGASNATTSAGATTQSATPSAAGTQTPAAAAYTDAQLRAYIAAKNEIEPLQANLATQTPEQQTQTRQQIAAILQRNSLSPEQFNGIARMSNEDRTFAARLAALQPNTFTDETLRAFAAASVEIDPISRNIATQTPEQRAASTEQIRQILQRNNLDSATYNAIAARAQADPALASRIASLNRPNQAPG
jgi:hypothetical protein